MVVVVQEVHEIKKEVGLGRYNSQWDTVWVVGC